MMHALGLAAPPQFNPGHKTTSLFTLQPSVMPIMPLVDRLEEESEAEEILDGAEVLVLHAAPPAPLEPLPSAPPAPPAVSLRFSNDGTGDSNRCRNAWEKIMKAKLGTTKWKELMECHALDKHVPIRLVRRYAIEHQVSLPEPCDLRVAHYIFADVPEAQWRVPTSCKGYERQIREHGFCPTSLCETCDSLRERDCAIARRRAAWMDTAPRETVIDMAASEFTDLPEPEELDEFLSKLNWSTSLGEAATMEKPAPAWSVSELADIVHTLASDNLSNPEGTIASRKRSPTWADELHLKTRARCAE